ncbi:MAG: polysaccharide deacetylase family protein [Magnetospiraceae bacterium]
MPSPALIVVIDTEEEFDWSQPFSRDNTAVTSMDHQGKAQEIFARHGMIPTYVIDYPVATTPSSIGVLRELHDANACAIGTHLHPWVNPPFEEAVNSQNSYPGNLPAPLERAKLTALTEAIEQNLAVRPTVYKAGRYGIGPNTPAILTALGYEIDVSMVPRTWFTEDGGPDFRQLDSPPFRFGPEDGLLEIPLSVGYCGLLRQFGARLYPPLATPEMVRLHAPGVFARSGLLERIRLSPEGADLEALKRLTRAMVARGDRVFSLTYHSPSLMPGCTPYVRDTNDLSVFLGIIDGYLRFFKDEIGGQFATPEEILSHTP